MAPKVPVVQELHTLDPAVLLYFPEGHWVHVDVPLIELKLPGKHGVHVEAPLSLL
jgi:hypothetical protein